MRLAFRQTPTATRITLGAAGLGEGSFNKGSDLHEVNARGLTEMSVLIIVTFGVGGGIAGGTGRGGSTGGSGSASTTTETAGDDVRADECSLSD